MDTDKQPAGGLPQPILRTRARVGVQQQDKPEAALSLLPQSLAVADLGFAHAQRLPSSETGCTAMASLTCPQTEHWTWLAPLGYMSTTVHCWLVQTSCAMFGPAAAQPG